MYQRTCRFSPPQSLYECFYHVFCLQVFPDMVTHDFSGAGIRDQTQISRAAAQRKISYISDPDLLWLKGGDLFRAGFQQIRMPVKAMMAVGGFVICPFHWHQKPVFIHQVKQTVSSNIQPFIGLSVQQIVQFTRTDSRLTAPDAGNKIKNLSMMFLPFSAPCVVLIPCLSAVPQELAYACNGYFWGRTLREDLPGRFFTTLTP
ncbi:Uncharacterised protein [Cedecea lapagei]|uniref:Uncharacterized protein n=1 Tax=Cedecea lapagei TaxID=158823 RepID=A0A447UZM4_9ENTR|nr:Uncharacterised protein [Cedecea lapagei]